MNDILKMLKKIDSLESKKTLTESGVAECGEMGAMSMPAEPVNQGNPVTASITLNASGMDHVADLMRLLQQAGLEKAGPVADPTMPMRTDMENLRDKMNGLEGPPSEPKPQYFDTDDVTGGGDDIHSKKEPEDIRIKDSSIADDIRDSSIEEWENEPEEDHRDHLEMIKRLAGGINGEKKMHKPASQGDNAMAVEAEEDDDDDKKEDDVRESIKERLLKALSEKKTNEAGKKPDPKKAAALAKANKDAQPKDKVSLKKAPWEKD